MARGVASKRVFRAFFLPVTKETERTSDRPPGKKGERGEVISVAGRGQRLREKQIAVVKKGEKTKKWRDLPLFPKKKEQKT